MIINSLLDTDLYKFTMMQVVLHQFPGAQVEYRFKCRNAHKEPAPGAPSFDLAPFVSEIRDEIRSLCSLQFHDAELAYLRSMRFIKSDFIDFLGLFHLNEKYITVRGLPNGDIDITIQGPWLHTILFEIPVLAIVNEVYFRNTHKLPDLVEGRKRLDTKIGQLRGDTLGDLKIADYGTRRRFSQAWHEEVLRVLAVRLGTLQSPGHAAGTAGQFAGTSNVLFAMKLGLTPLGTMAHEYLQACQALGPRLRDSQIYGFESWAKEYRGDLGIALSDVYGIDAFLRDFDMYFCKLFDGARHDSGDPFSWGERMLAHYARNRVDPRTKILIFSDGLTVPRTIELYQQFRGRCQLAFGIGTNLTNDLGYEPLQIVIKMVRCNGQPVAKLSDTPSKNMCDDERYLAYLRQVFEIPQVGLVVKPGITIARAIFPEVIERLQVHFDVLSNQSDELLNTAELTARLQGRAGLLSTGNERVDGALLAACPALKICANMSVGYNNLDIDAMNAAGVLGTNAPDVLTETTADFGFALLMATARRVTESEHFLRAGKWTRWSYDMFAGVDVHGTTLGIIGMGRIGQGIARRGAHGFGMRVLYHNRSRLDAATEAACKATYVGKQELLQAADHVVLVVPYSAASHHTIGSAELALMKPTATLVNIGRGGIVDDAALALALSQRRIAGAGLDVFEGEPQVHPGLRQVPNVVLTPHIASATLPTRLAMSNLAADNLIGFLIQGKPLTPVNPAVLAKAWVERHG